MKKNTISSNSTSSHAGWLNGFIGVLLFSGSMPATKVAVLSFDPLFVTASRANIATFLAVVALLLFKQKIPTRSEFKSIAIVALGGVIGFPLLSALALQYISAAHSLVFLGILPLCTAVFAVLLTGEKTNRLFWLFSVLGSFLIIGFALSQGSEHSLWGTVLMAVAILLCGLSYAEGAKVSKTVGGWQVISWALVVSLPFTIPLQFLAWPTSFVAVPLEAWVGIGYLGTMSMFLGFVFWYKGLSQGGIAAVGQLQLLQPFFGLALTASLLSESVSLGMILITLGVIACVAGGKKYASPARLPKN